MRISDLSSDVCSSDLVEAVDEEHDAERDPQNEGGVGGGPVVDHETSPFAAPPCERWGRAASCDGREAMLCLCASRLATYASFHCIFAKMGRPEMNQAGDVAADLRTLLAIARDGSLAGAEIGRATV